MTQTRATIREAPAAGESELVLPRSELDRLGLVSGALVTVDIQMAPSGSGVASREEPPFSGTGNLLRDLQQAIAAADAGDLVEDESVRQEFVERFAGRISPDLLRQLQES